MRPFVIAACLAMFLYPPGIWPAFVPAAISQRPHRLEAPCNVSGHPALGGVFCYSPGRFGQVASGLPFAAFDPEAVVRQSTHLAERAVIIQRVSYPRPGGIASPLGPPEQIVMDFGKTPSRADYRRSPQRAATYVRVIEYRESYNGRPRVSHLGADAQWVFTADDHHQRMSIEVESDGPKAVVRAIGTALFMAENHLSPKPDAPERVYVAPPRALQVGVPATFWILVAPRWGTYPFPAYDFDFTLGGAWSRPGTETPDGSQACGGDNVAGQPVHRHGRWVFRWGDCPELGLTLIPRSTGIHRLAIYGYSVPVTSQGTLDRKHEKLAPGSGYCWQGTIGQRLQGKTDACLPGGINAARLATSGSSGSVSAG